MMSHQPYRRHPQRPQTMALLAMLRGRSAHGANPIDLWRLAQHQHKLGLLRYLR